LVHHENSKIQLGLLVVVIFRKLKQNRENDDADDAVHKLRIVKATKCRQLN